MELDQGGARLPQAAIIFRQAADAGAVAGGQRADARLAGLAPGEHGGRMQGPLRFGTVAGSISAAGLQKIDRAFD